MRDARLRVRAAAAHGLTRSLNRALGLARAALVARLDADDLALPERLARQRAFLAAHPDVGLLGTAAREVDPTGAPVRHVPPPADDAALRRALIRANPFVHSSIMARRALLARAGGYDERLAVAQDYDLWMRLAGLTLLANLAEVLVVRRLRPGAVSVSARRTGCAPRRACAGARCERRLPAVVRALRAAARRWRSRCRARCGARCARPAGSRA